MNQEGGSGVTRLMPTGECWCGCGAETTIGAFFVAGHDKVAESAVVIVEYGSVPEFIQKHGYGPGGKNPRQTVQEWRQRGGKYMEES
jgi:hypothetical protein